MTLGYPRQGLRIRCEQGVHADVRKVCLQFAKWLRENFEFPIRVVIYLKRAYQIRNRYTKELVSATFFAPFEKDVESYIRIATGDYEELLGQLGEESALLSYLYSIGHELGHYYQWIDDTELDEDEADNNANYILELYRENIE
jgi:hypothetical protein